MAIKDVFLVRNYKDKEGKEKAEWVKSGICFGTNKDGSQNFELYMLPGVKFQIRDRKEKEEQAPF